MRKPPQMGRGLVKGQGQGGCVIRNASEVGGGRGEQGQIRKGLTADEMAFKCIMLPQQPLQFRVLFFTGRGMHSDNRFRKMTWLYYRKDRNSCSLEATGSYWGGRQETNKDLEYIGCRGTMGPIQKNESGKGGGTARVGSLILNRVAWKSLSGKVALERSHEGGEGESIPGRETADAKALG